MSNVKNPFEIANPENEGSVQKYNASTSAEEARAIQEVQASLIIAKRFPRNQIEAMDKILAACTRPTLAESAMYSYSRGGAAVTGPSIRLAETIAQVWGHISFGIRELSSTGGESTVEAFAWDLETNTRQTKVFIVKHERHSRKGVKDLTDPRDIYETVANNGARRLRACILGIIPGDVTEAAVSQCEETARASADMSQDGLKKVLAAFESINVTKKQIEKRIQCRFHAIRPAQIVNLRKIFQSINDEMSVADDWFEKEDESMRANVESVKEAPSLKDKLGVKEEGVGAESTAEPEPQVDEDGDVILGKF